MRIIGIMSILIGFALTVFTTVSFFTRGRVFDAGGLEISKSNWYSYSWSPVLGIALIIIGGILVYVAARRTIVVLGEMKHI